MQSIRNRNKRARERDRQINAFKEKLRIIAGSVLKIKSTTILHKQQITKYKRAKRSKRKKKRLRKHGNYINFRKISIICSKTSFFDSVYFSLWDFEISIFVKQVRVISKLEFPACVCQIKIHWPQMIVASRFFCQTTRSTRWHRTTKSGASIWLISDCMASGQRRVSGNNMCWTL